MTYHHHHHYGRRRHQFITEGRHTADETATRYSLDGPAFELQNVRTGGCNNIYKPQYNHAQ